MIRHHCDFCGRETDAGKNIDTTLSLTIPSKRMTKRHVREDHTASRYVRLGVKFGIDGCDLSIDRLGHDLCGPCRAQLLRQLADCFDSDDAP